METATRRERKKEETRLRLFDKAFGLFVKQGYEQTTIAQITNEADIGKGTFYNYFSSKEALLSAFIENVSVQRGDELLEVINNLPDTRQRLMKVFQSITSWMEKYPELIRVYVMDRNGVALNDPANYKMSHSEIYILEILKKGQQMGDIRKDIDPTQLVHYLMGTFMLQLCGWFAGGSGVQLSEQSMYAVDFFLQGAQETGKSL